MNHIKRLGWMTLNLAAMLALAGCGKGGGGFNAAPPEIKATWDKAVAADKANDYVAAVAGYREILLQRDKLGEDQTRTAETASIKLNQRLVDAASSGDPAARQALAAQGAADRRR